MQLNLGDLSISSPAFDHDGPIPARHAGDADNVSPPLAWGPVPDGAPELALVCHDPDAPLVDGFTHWVAYGIDPSASGVDEGRTPGVDGVNETGGAGWTGPLPPPGHGTHHYVFWVYALDTALGAAPGLTRAQLLQRIDGHVLEQARIVGTYQR